MKKWIYIIAGILVLLTIGVVAQNQVGNPLYVAALKPPSSGTCTVSSTLTNLVNNDQATSSDPGIVSQKLPNAVALDICQIEVTFAGSAGNPTITLQCRSAENGGGSQYGGDSSTFQLTGGAQTHIFTFSSHPNPTGDFFINILQSGGTSMSPALDSSKAFQASYQAFFGAGGHDWTCVFRVFTIQ